MSQPTTGILFSNSTPPASTGDQVCTPQTDGAIPQQKMDFVPKRATASLYGTIPINAIQQESYIYAADTGAANAYAIALSPAPTIVAGSVAVVKAANANTGPSTLAVNGGSAVSILKGGSVPLAADDIAAGQIFTVIFDGTNWQIAATGSLPAGTGSPLLRGTGDQDGNAASYTISWPSGTVAGDLVLLFGTHGYNLAVPTGWATLYASTGGAWNGFAASRVLDSADISAGSVTIAAAGSYYGIFAIAAFIGAAGGIRETHGNDSAGAGATDTLSTSGAVLNTDAGIYFGSARAGSTPTVSMSPGSTLQSPANAVAAGILADQSMPGGVTAQGFTYSNAGAGFFHAIVIVEGVPLAPVVTSLNELTGDLTLESSDSSVDITVVGTSIDLTVSSGGSSPLTTKGDLYGFTTAAARVPIGADTQVLTADSTQSLGLKWAAAGGSSIYFGQGDASATSGNNAITLGSTPLAGSILVFINGAPLIPSSGFTVAGAVLSLATSLSGSNEVIVYWATTNATPGGITLSTTGGSSPVVRGTGIQASSASSFTVSWPAGTVAGDLALIFCGGGWGATAPAGWTSLDNSTGSFWNGAVFSKVLNSTDITAGSVAVSFGGSFDAVLGVVTFIGGTAGIRETDVQRNSSGSLSISLSTSGSVLNTDTCVYFGSNRAASTDTVSRGTLKQQANDGSAASGCLYTEAIATSGAVSATFDYSASGSGNYQAIVVVKGV